MSRFPISRVCPECASKGYTVRKSQAFVAFANDRVCKFCLTRYSPPTPLWGGITFMLSGLALPVLGFVLIALLALLFGPFVSPFSILGLTCEGVFCILALVCFIGGIRLLVTSQIVGGAESVRNSSPAALEARQRDNAGSASPFGGDAKE
jgi:hypothetical protein